MRLYESGCRHGNDRARHLPIDIGNVGHIRVVVHVGDIDIIDDGVAGINPGEIVTAHRIRGSVNLAWSEWEPGNSTAAAK